MSEHQGPGIRYRSENGVGWVTFDNPSRHNAMTLEMMDTLRPAIARFERDVRVIVLRGAGGRAFTSGGDLKELARNRETPEGTRAYRKRFRDAVDAVTETNLPTIAAIDGYCMGGGMALALACDLRIVTPNAQFAFPSARLGSGFDYGAIEKLTALVGPAHAKEMFFTATPLGGAEAARIGLANRCHADKDFDQALDALAATIAGNAPLSLVALKRGVEAASTGLADGALGHVVDQLEACAESDDHREGRLAHAEKRRPVFHGR